MADALVELLSKPPASFAWSTAEDGGRTIGTAEGFVIDLWPDRVEVAALFPPDNTALSERNSVLMQLIMLALRPEWHSASSWLAQAMRMAARGHAEQINVSRRVRFVWDATQSRATLRIQR